MLIRNTENRYGAVAVFLHWLMAILLIFLLAAGLYMTRIPVSMEKLRLYGWHKEWGLLVLALVMLRLVWRLGNQTPLLTNLAGWERFAAHAVHWAFYVFMITLPITGWLLTSAAGLAPSFFGIWLLPNLVAPNPHSQQIFTLIHEYLAYGLILAFGAHVGAALKHHFINKDDILRRML